MLPTNETYEYVARMCTTEFTHACEMSPCTDGLNHGSRHAYSFKVRDGTCHVH